MSKYILGISAYYHDSAAVLLDNTDIIAAVHEERFTRKKHDPSFPVNAVGYVLKEAGIDFGELSLICFYEKPFIKFERLLETYYAFAPRGLKSYLSAIPVWTKEKLFMKKLIKDKLKQFGSEPVQIMFPEHHLSHAASAFYPSPFEEAAILTVDGVGEWATATLGHGHGKEIEILAEMHFPHSVGLLYSAFTYYTGFRVNSGEYKLMGLAPYGNPDAAQTRDFRERILNELIDIREDGSILLNMKYFRYATGLRMTNDREWKKLFGIPPRHPESEITQEYMNMALAIQQVTEEIVLKMARTVKNLTGSDYLVMAGGVALNSVANGKLLRSGLFRDIWVQPAAGDAGGALGAAYLGALLGMDGTLSKNNGPDAMQGAFLGPWYNRYEIATVLKRYRAPYKYFDNFEELVKKTAADIAAGKVVGWFQGRMEYGPRALGNRSILGDARNPEMQKKMNLKIKYREGFRPFAPTVLEEDIQEYFDMDRPSPYMLMVIPVRKDRQKPLPDGYADMKLYDRLYHQRSDIPAVTHIDYSARIQSVNKSTNPRYWALINEFKNQTGCGVIVNTSFNVRGEPIVCTPDDAYRCFMRTEMDVLVLENYYLEKGTQSSLREDTDWKEEFTLD